jgi:hypothetical protein
MALVAREHQGYPWPVLFWVCCSALGGTCFLVIAAVMMLEAAEDRWLARRGGHRDAP